MAMGNLGPDFVSSYSNRTIKDCGSHFTADQAKRMCYEDAKLIRYFVNRQAYFQWMGAVNKFCCGNDDLRDCLLGMTGCYVDYLNGYVSADTASKKMGEKVSDLRISLSKAYRPKMIARPFMEDPSKAGSYDIRNLIVDVEKEKRLAQSPLLNRAN